MQILIAGASRGIGKYLAERLTSVRHKVSGTYNGTETEGNTAYSLNKVDIRDEEQVFRWIASAAKEADKLVLINCAGINYNSMLHKSDTEAWTKVIDTNLKAAYILMKHILPLMRDKQFGRVIHFSSVVPQIGVPGTSAYSASKAALWGLARATAMENAKYGITVNTVNLGYFDIGMIQEVPSEVLAEIIDRIPMARLGDPSNILNAVKFLIDSDYITGSQINLNGGLY